MGILQPQGKKTIHCLLFANRKATKFALLQSLASVVNMAEDAGEVNDGCAVEGREDAVMVFKRHCEECFGNALW